MEFRDVVSTLGLAFGVAGSFLSVLNYRRDRYRVLVSLYWDMTMTSDSGRTKRRGVIVVANTGRRSIFVSHTALKLPATQENSHLLIPDGVLGRKLSEGDPPAVYIIEQDDMEPYSDSWMEIVAQVSDSSGNVWCSEKPTKKPSWGTDR